MLLEEKMRGGFYLLGKTRYTLGCSAVSSLQLPNEECEVQSLVTVVSTPLVLQEYSGDVMHHTFDAKFIKPVTGNAENNSKEKLSCDDKEKVSDENLGLRKRFSGISGEKKTEEGNDCEVEEKRDTRDGVTNQDPIRWFSALPPQTLRQAQQEFKAAIQLIAQCATTQLKLSATNKEFERLYDIKSKIDAVEKES